MKITIDVSDFYLEEGQIKEELQRAIVAEAVMKIKDSLKRDIDNVKTMAENAIKSFMDTEISHQISLEIAKVVSSEKVRKDSYSKEEFTIQQLIKEKMTGIINEKHTKGVVLIEAEKIVKELKQRYDLLFASQIVAKLSDGGLLKEDAKKLLLD